MSSYTPMENRGHCQNPSACSRRNCNGANEKAHAKIICDFLIDERGYGAKEKGAVLHFTIEL